MINQKNEGTFLARWHGIQQSKGEYILFLDIDDEFETDIFEKLLEYEYQKYDVVQFRFKKIDKCVSYSYMDPKFLNCKITNKDDIFPLDDGKYYLFDKCYKRTLFPDSIEECKFIKATNFEDGALNAVLLSGAKNKFNLDCYLYKYIIRSDSMCMKGHKNYHNLMNDYHLVWALSKLSCESKPFLFISRCYYTLFLQRIYYYSKEKNRYRVAKKMLKKFLLELTKDVREYKIPKINKVIKIKKELVLYAFFKMRMFSLIIFLCRHCV